MVGKGDANTDVPGVGFPCAVRNEDSTGDTIVVQVVKVFVLGDGGARVGERARAFRVIRSSLERRDASRIKAWTVDVGVDGEAWELVGEGIEGKMTSSDITQTDLTGSITSLDGIEEILVEGELGNDALRRCGDGEHSDCVRQQERTNSKVDLVAVGGNLNPEIVSTSNQAAVVDNNGVFGINRTIDSSS